MLQPKKVRQKTTQGAHTWRCSRRLKLTLETMLFKSLEPERVTSRQIESARRALTRHMKRQGRVWIRIFPDVPVTAKPIEVRMGKGKGSVDRWVAKVKPGRIMFEIDGVSPEIAQEALRLAAMKLPVKCKFVTRGEIASAPNNWDM